MKHYSIHLIGIFFCLFCTTAAHAQKEYYCEGYVKDDNGDPITYVRIEIPSPEVVGRRHQINEFARGFTNEDGYYRMKIPASWEKIRIDFTAPGYKGGFLIDTIITQTIVSQNKRQIKLPDVKMISEAFPDQVIIRGRVIDKDTGKPISGAQYIAPASGLVIAITNRLGYYYFLWGCHVTKNFTCRLNFSKDGYNYVKLDTNFFAEKSSIVYLPDLKMKKSN